MQLVRNPCPNFVQLNPQDVVQISFCCVSQAETHGQTSVEMEALTACTAGSPFTTCARPWTGA
ncbi:MAG: hypothetical protein EBV20_08950 [Betaproteobacteria bacterium]|nr:hypothetical protein [Betaproteobacteria bacterium]